MRFEIILAPEAERAYRRLSARQRGEIRDAIGRHLRFEPTKVSQSRIKRLRGFQRPQYRLRVNEIRVFYDVTTSSVEILAIVPKAEAERWLGDAGTPDDGASSESEG